MKKPGYKIAMLGAGNMAWHLAPALEKAGHEVVLVYSRTLENAQTLAKALKATQSTDKPDFTNSPADLYLVAVKDTALPGLLQQAVFPEGSLVAHTSGTQPLSVFESSPEIRGAVFYPLQTFSKNTPVDFGNIPFCLEATDENAMFLLRKMAGSLSQKVYDVSSQDRKTLHLAAVFACNFTNHLLGISSEILQKRELDFQMLKPLVEATVQKAFSQEPFSVQTGPAVRRDETTIQEHLQLLQHETGYQEIYRLLTQSIQQKS
ncbi:Rossmann-like and DUF2520 domain-containing protein [Adhaeribacter soli]|uniref:DUF2520 domain-containing protein n=1 Tax=Adhaeribacter soli TaxID=2607655 RepID=A0A5N1IQI2_9BACT|nr:Rossmann-like and DUF2520 domain-containing protein [Adhaeribacter soli]KAA9331223.1 DUF2520 domain-containing protein [Adhaeribacter soli]